MCISSDGSDRDYVHFKIPHQHTNTLTLFTSYRIVAVVANALLLAVDAFS